MNVAKVYTIKHRPADGPCPTCPRLTFSCTCRGGDPSSREAVRPYRRRRRCSTRERGLHIFSKILLLIANDGGVREGEGRFRKCGAGLPPSLKLRRDAP